MRMTWHLRKIACFLNQVGCGWFLMDWSVKPSKFASKLTTHLMPSWALRESFWTLYLNLRFIEFGFIMTFSGIRILTRFPRKPIKNCTFSGCSRGFNFNNDELLSVYKIYVRPVVEYADVVWSSSITAA